MVIVQASEFYINKLLDNEPHVLHGSRNVYSLKRVAFIALLDGLQHPFVYPEADGDGEKRQGHVGQHADDAAHAERQQEQETRSEHDARVLHVAPVQQLHHCRHGNTHTHKTLLAKPYIKQGTQTWSNLSSEMAAMRYLR